MPSCHTPYGRISYSCNGAAPGRTPLVLIHGAGGQARDWPDAWRYRVNTQFSVGVPKLSSAPTMADRPVYAIDLPGHGASAGPAASDVTTYARAVLALCSALGLSRYGLCGHSMGGAIALDAALQKPERLAGLVIVGAAARLPVTDDILTGLREAFAQTTAAISRYCWHRDAPAVYRETGRRRMLRCGSEVVHGDFAACGAFDVRDRLGEITCPALVVAGEKDRMVPADKSRALADGLPQSRFVEIPQCGHFLHVEKTAETGAAVSAFLRQSCDP